MREPETRSAARWGATGVGAIGIVLWASETALASLTNGLPVFEIVGLAFAAAALLSPLGWWVAGESPALAFRQKPWVWAVTVLSLVGYHTCIYAAVHHVPAAPAALLQGGTPLFIVFGSAAFCGVRLRWWHLVGALGGLEGMVALALEGRGHLAFGSDAPVYLLVIGLAAGLWGLYSLFSSRFTAVPTSAMGMFYAASALLALGLHAALEPWVAPTMRQWGAILALGILPMGLALFCWDHGLKKGDVQALGILTYVEPAVGAVLVVLMGQGTLTVPVIVSGLVIISAAVFGSANLFEPPPEPTAGKPGPAPPPLPSWLPATLRTQLVVGAAACGVPVETFVQHSLEYALRNGRRRRARAVEGRVRRWP